MRRKFKSVKSSRLGSRGSSLVTWRLQRSQRKILDRHPQPNGPPKKKKDYSSSHKHIEVKDGNLENEFSLQMANEPLSTSMVGGIDKDSRPLWFFPGLKSFTKNLSKAALTP